MKRSVIVANISWNPRHWQEPLLTLVPVTRMPENIQAMSL